jgi:hypothetical protein
VAPVFNEHSHRIEAILLCYFIAMLTGALIEREIRTSMKEQRTEKHPPLSRVPRLSIAEHPTKPGGLR